MKFKPGDIVVLKEDYTSRCLKGHIGRILHVRGDVVDVKWLRGNSFMTMGIYSRRFELAEDKRV